jgi:hypothetical protein
MKKIEKDIELPLLSEEDCRDIASRLPKYPGLTDTGDTSTADFLPELTDEELEAVYKIYIDELGGTMDLRHETGMNNENSYPQAD